MVSGGHLENITFGENVTAPAWLYIDQTDGKAYKATTTNRAMCVTFVDGVTNGGGQAWFSGVADWPSTLVAGAEYYVSGTAGSMTRTKPTSYQSLGRAISTDKFLISPADIVYYQQAFPVNSIFTSVVSTDPATLLGYGTWSAFGAGRVLVGIDAGQTEFDTVEETGGSKTHTLTTAEMPSHTHIQDAHTHIQNAHTHTQSINSSPLGTTSGYAADSTTSNSVTSGYSTGSTTATNQNTTATNQNTGGGGAHNNLQPYIVVYFWKRTA